MTRRSNTEEFVGKALAVHGTKYRYTKVSYLKALEKVCITCPAHGEFMQTPANHLSGVGCPVCANIANGVRQRVTTDRFVAAAIARHGNRYDYSLVSCSFSKDKVRIVCKAHGEFMQAANNHLTGSGCPTCGKAKAASIHITPVEEFVSLAVAAHGSKFDYSDLRYTTASTKARFTCSCGKVFWQMPIAHLKGDGGCPACCSDTRRLKKRIPFDVFLTRARETHGDRYEYSESKYLEMSSLAGITCRLHGEFKQEGAAHVNGAGCPICARTTSKAEEAIAEFISTLNVRVVRNDRRILDRAMEIDVLVVEKKIGVELNGLYWHSELRGKGRHYHQSKTDAAAKAGYSLIHITDLQWETRKEAVKSMLMARCGVEMEKFDARKCLIVSPSVQEMREFLERSHIQGFRPSKEHYGLSYGDKLVAVASFGLSKAREAELQRYATLPGMRVRGGLGRLVAHWRRLHEGTDLISFCDTTYFDGRSYRAVGFVQEKILGPDYSYTDGISCYSKEAFRKAHLAERFDNYDRALTEKENAENNGWYRIWGCNKIKFRLPALVKFPN